MAMFRGQCAAILHQELIGERVNMLVGIIIVLGTVNATLILGPKEMSIFSLEKSKANGTLPENCRELIKRYKTEGMFDISSITDGKQEYTTIYLLMTQDCNLNCTYCYQPKEFRQSNRIMSKKIIDDTVKFALKYFDESKLKFSLFGGEPLMNFEAVKYMVEKYPMFRYVITTNGLVFIKDKDVREWVMKQKNCLKVSVSVASLKKLYGGDYLSVAEPALQVVAHNGTDVHYVVEKPTDDVYEELVYLFGKVPTVRISTTRHCDSIIENIDGYIELFRAVADYLYFSGKPQFGRCQWDVAFKNNVYRKLKGITLKEVPPTFCGCGYLYLAVNDKGDLYPCDFFANYPEFKVGDIYNGFNDTCYFFKKMGDWIDGLYEDCRDCKVCEGDIRLCPRAMCLAENYTMTGNPLKPAKNHCLCNEVEYANFKYIAQKAIETGTDKVYEKASV
jgi:uncharacterized protein